MNSVDLRRSLAMARRHAERTRDGNVSGALYSTGPPELPKRRKGARRQHHSHSWTGTRWTGTHGSSLTFKRRDQPTIAHPTRSCSPLPSAGEGQGEGGLSSTPSRPAPEPSPPPPNHLPPGERGSRARTGNILYTINREHGLRPGFPGLARMWGKTSNPSLRVRRCHPQYHVSFEFASPIANTLTNYCAPHPQLFPSPQRGRGTG